MPDPTQRTDASIPVTNVLGLRKAVRQRASILAQDVLIGIRSCRNIRAQRIKRSDMRAGIGNHGFDNRRAELRFGKDTDSIAVPDFVFDLMQALCSGLLFR